MSKLEQQPGQARALDSSLSTAGVIRLEHLASWALVRYNHPSVDIPG